jgi:Flp pilus assembly protein TadG
MLHPLSPRGGSRRRGVAVAELAVLAPVLAFLFLMVIDFARIFYYSITIENCAEVSALFASQCWDNQNQQWIGNVQYWQGPSSSVSGAQGAGELDGTNLSPALADSNINVTTGKDADGNSVAIVKVTYTFDTIAPFWGIASSITLTRTAQMRIGPAAPS